MPEGDITPTFINYSDIIEAFASTVFKKAPERATEVVLYESL